MIILQRTGNESGYYIKEVTIKVSDEVTLTDLIESFRLFAIALGYNAEHVSELLNFEDL